MPRVLIAGAGTVGLAAAGRLSASGHDVFTLSRRPDLEPDPNQHHLQADLTDAASLSVVPGELDVVIYCAGPDESTDAAYERAYLIGLENVLSATTARRVVFTSSTAVYAQQHGEWVDETSPTEPTHFSGKRLLQAEALLRERVREPVVLRLGGIYGPGRDRLVRAVLDGSARCAPEPEPVTNRIHRDDAAGALVHLALHPKPETVYLGADDEPATRSAVLRFIADALGKPPPPLADAPVETSGRRGRSEKRCRNARLRASGYDFAFPTFREGYADVIARRTSSTS